MEMNEQFIGLCLDELKVFYDSLKDDNVPDVPAITEELLTEAKEISKSCMLLGSYKSCRTPDIFTQPNFVYFTKEINIKKKDKECKMEKGQEPAKDENANEKMEPQKRSKRKDQEYQTFVWGSNGIRNSCFIDSFLEVMFHIWLRQDMTVLPEALKESLVQRKKKSFHASKMILWKFLNDHPINRYDTFDLGEMAAITAIVDNLYDNLLYHERSKYFLLNETRTKCLTNDHHNRQRLSHYPIVYLYRKYLTFDLIDESNNFDLCSLVEYTLNDNCVENSICHVCQKQQSVTIKVTNHPAHFFVEVQQDRASKIKPMLKWCAITIDNYNYDLARHNLP